MHQRLRHRAHGQEGFTLIELLVVILIIGILAAVAIPTFLSQTGKAKDSNVQSNLNTVQTAESTQNTTTGTWVTGSSAISTLGNTEPTVKTFGTNSGGNISISATAPSYNSDPTGSTTSAVAYSASGYAGSSSSSAVTYYLTVYADGGVADTCSVPSGVNSGACNLVSGSSTNGTWGNGNS